MTDLLDYWLRWTPNSQTTPQGWQRKQTKKKKPKEKK